MSTSNKAPKTVDEYISKAPKNIHGILRRIRQIIKTAAPNAVEGISYGMPAYSLNGKPLVYFAAFPRHIGFYATPETHEDFVKELSKYKQGKGSVQFPLDQSMPYDLIEKMTAYKANLLK